MSAALCLKAQQVVFKEREHGIGVMFTPGLSGNLGAHFKGAEIARLLVSS